MVWKYLAFRKPAVDWPELSLVPLVSCQSRGQFIVVRPVPLRTDLHVTAIPQNVLHISDLQHVFAADFKREEEEEGGGEASTVY